MKHNLFILLIAIILIGCKKVEIVTPAEEKTELIINWKHPYYGNSSWKENAMIYLYENEDDYENHNSNPVLSQSLSDLNTTSFNNLKPVKYWVKIFNAYNHEKLVEHNQDSSYFFNYPLIENSITTVTIPTKRIYLNSYTIEKIEIYDIPSWLDINNGDQVTVKIFEKFPSSYGSEQNKVLDSKTTTMNNSMIIYEPTNIVIDRFNSWWYDPDYYIVLNKEGSLSEEYYEINIFELLNSNAHFGSKYIKRNNNNKIEYKLHVVWNIQ